MKFSLDDAWAADAEGRNKDFSRQVDTPVNPPDVRGALKAAVAAIYFNDSSDYEGALWDIVRCLDFATAELLAEDEKKAYDTICGEAG